MKSYRLTSLVLLSFFFTQALKADWPQWRGPDRDGVAAASAALPDVLDDDNAPMRLWDSEEVPSDHYGGHGSVAIANGRVYLSVVWHRNEPTETRRIDRDVLSTLGYRGTSGLSAEIREKMETDRLGLSRRLRGAALDEWSKQWVEENLSPKEQLSLGSWIASRFKKGQAAIPLAVYDILLKAPKGFENQGEMEAWVKEQNFDPIVESQIIAAVPATVKVADDVILCLDAETGETLWKFSVPGFPSGRSSSSTPTIVEDKLYALLSTNLYCINAESGEEVWQTELPVKKGLACSPLVYEGKVYTQLGALTAYDSETGEELWTNKEVTTTNSSPAVHKGVILCNSKDKLVGVDHYSGATLWEVPGGGDGTPVVSGDYVIISSRVEGSNLIAYRITETIPEEVWSLDFLARRYGSTPIVHDDHVYYMGSQRHMCIDLKTGDIRWEKEAQSSISSPLLADGKLLVYENRGGFAAIIKASPESYEVIGKAKVGALYCASPALVNRDLFLRTSKNVVCFRFPEP